MLKVDENKVGLGSLNQLYMSMELLLLEETINTFKLVLIEEIEAHIHPQAQLRVIKYLQSKENTQFIITTHSITLASVVKVENLILCNNNNVFPMNRGYTKLDAGDYEFLNRFLDATKSNLLFAKGVILDDGRQFFGDEIVSGIGREGSEWFSNLCKKHNIETQVGTVDIGVRVEVRDEVMEFLNKNLYEAKLVYYTPTFDDKVRTFCTNPSGEVATEYYQDICVS